MTKEEVTFKKGTFSIGYKERDGRQTKREVTGLVTSSGIGIHKGIDRKGYVLVQVRSGLGIAYADSLADAKVKAQRLSGVTNWHKNVKPSYKLAQKVKYAEKGEKVPSNRKRDDYDIKAHGHRQGRTVLVEHTYAYGYKGQQRERSAIRKELHQKHIGYTVEVTNTTKNRRIK